MNVLDVDAENAEDRVDDLQRSLRTGTPWLCHYLDTNDLFRISQPGPYARRLDLTFVRRAPPWRCEKQL